MLTAAEIMEKTPPTVGPDMSVEELGRLFIKFEISGLPVVDANGKLIGIVTENDFISQNKKLHIPTMLRIFDAFIPMESPSAVEQEMKKIAGITVGDICTKDPITIEESTQLDEIATIITEHKAHHLPVLRDGKLVGMVTQHLVVRGIAAEKNL